MTEKRTPKPKAEPKPEIEETKVESPIQAPAEYFADAKKQTDAVYHAVCMYNDFFSKSTEFSYVTNAVIGLAEKSASTITEDEFVDLLDHQVHEFYLMGLFNVTIERCFEIVQAYRRFLGLLGVVFKSA